LRDDLDFSRSFFENLREERVCLVARTERIAVGAIDHENNGTLDDFAVDVGTVKIREAV